LRIRRASGILLSIHKNMFSSILTALQLALAVVLILVILLQQKGSGLGAAFGGGSDVFTTRRGIDKVLYQITIVTSILFFGVALANVMV